MVPILIGKNPTDYELKGTKNSNKDDSMIICIICLETMKVNSEQYKLHVNRHYA